MDLVINDYDAVVKWNQLVPLVYIKFLMFAVQSQKHHDHALLTDQFCHVSEKKFNSSHQSIIKYKVIILTTA